MFQFSVSMSYLSNRKGKDTQSEAVLRFFEPVKMVLWQGQHYMHAQD